MDGARSWTARHNQVHRSRWSVRQHRRFEERSRCSRVSKVECGAHSFLVPRLLGKQILFHPITVWVLRRGLVQYVTETLTIWSFNASRSHLESTHAGFGSAINSAGGLNMSAHLTSVDLPPHAHIIISASRSLYTCLRPWNPLTLLGSSTSQLRASEIFRGRLMGGSDPSNIREALSLACSLNTIRGNFGNSRMAPLCSRLDGFCWNEVFPSYRKR